MIIAVHLAWRLRLGVEAPKSVLVSKACKLPALVKPIVLLNRLRMVNHLGLGKDFENESADASPLHCRYFPALSDSLYKPRLGSQSARLVIFR